MATVKGKIKLCQTQLDNFNSESINGSPFYCRYVEFLRVFKKHCAGLDPDVIFAQPEIDEAKGVLDWYIPKTQEPPVSLASIKASSPKLYDKYDGIRNTLKQRLKEITSGIPSDQEKEYLSCAVKYLDSEYADKTTYCYDDKVTFAVWGMKMRKDRDITTVITDDVKDHRTHTVTFTVEGHGVIDGKDSIIRKHGYCLGGKDIPNIKPDLHHSFVEWKPQAPHGKVVDADIQYTAVCKRTDDYEIEFVATEGGTIIGASTVMKKPGDCLMVDDVPQYNASSGYHFVKWQPSLTLNQTITDDLKYTALFEKDKEVVIPTPPDPPAPPAPPADSIHKVLFNAGDNGSLKGNNAFDLKSGDYIPQSEIPVVEPKPGYKFTGWDKSVSDPITNDTVYTAQYARETLPWWKRFWLWLTGPGCLTSGCLMWLLRLLGVLLLLLLLFWLLRSCDGCTGFREVNGVIPPDSITASDGRKVEDNGFVRPVTGDDGTLPGEDRGVAPVLGEGGEEPPVIRQPGTPSVIANRLFLFMENENDDVEALARDFKKAYPGDEYSIIGYDKEVKMLVIQIPEEERDEIRQTINDKIPDHKFIVFDEEIYELNGYVSDSPEDIGWHLDAIHLKKGWTYTKGDRDVRVAVVDDGIQSDHPMFEGKIADAYNVFTQSNKLSVGEGHGTHTAGLAVGSADYYSTGASGVAPNCTLIPIQVFDNKQCPLSALVAGVMYAIHHDADVVNVSIGPSFQGLNVLPVDVQGEIASTQFRNVALLWTRVCKLAAKKRTILVFAAGNDDILTSIPPENRNESSIVVTAVDKRMYPTEFTNYGPCSDISAPGKSIYSSFPSNTFRSCDGTSMAAPIVTGTIALMKSIKKDLTVEQARNVLYSTGADVYGWIPPMVLVDKALAATKAGDFKRVERTGKSVPDGVDVHLHSGQVPVDEPVGTVADTPPAATPDNGLNIEEIQRLIRECEENIRANEERKRKLENQLDRKQR